MTRNKILLGIVTAGTSSTNPTPQCNGSFREKEAGCRLVSWSQAKKWRKEEHPVHYYASEPVSRASPTNFPFRSFQCSLHSEWEKEHCKRSWTSLPIGVSGRPLPHHIHWWEPPEKMNDRSDGIRRFTEFAISIRCGRHRFLVDDESFSDIVVSGLSLVQSFQPIPGHCPMWYANYMRTGNFIGLIKYYYRIIRGNRR